MIRFLVTWNPNHSIQIAEIPLEFAGSESRSV